MQTSKVIIVTGAGSGMGRAAATRWARQGHQVAAVDRAADAIKELEATVPGVSAFECDVTDEDAVRRAADEIRDRLGDPDRLVSAAGICIPGKIGDAPPADFHKTMAVNFFGMVHWVDAVLPSMRSRHAGEIVLFSSVGGFLPTPGVDAYIASKFAVLGYAEILSQETPQDGIHVVCICPPPVDTPLLANFTSASNMSPTVAKFMRPMTPDQIIDSIEKALSSKRFLLLPSATAKASHAMRRLAPNTLNRVLKRFVGA